MWERDELVWCCMIFFVGHVGVGTPSTFVSSFVVIGEPRKVEDT